MKLVGRHIISLAKFHVVRVTISCFFGGFSMIRFCAATWLLLSIVSFPAYAATVDGTLVSIDTEGRTITLDSGAILALTEYVVLDGLQPGQLIRVTYTDETVDATTIDILQDIPPVETVDVPAPDLNDVSNSEVADPTTDVEANPDTEVVVSPEQ